MNSIIFICAAGYLCLINIITLIVYGIDKNRAKREKYRISEKTLIILAAVGGSIGAAAGMRLFHHKTKKPKFFIGIPVILILQIGLIAVVYVLFS